MIEGDLEAVKDASAEDVVASEDTDRGRDWRKADQLHEPEINGSLDEAPVRQLALDTVVWEAQGSR